MYNKKCVLGIDTSNYTTSVAIVDDNYNIIADERKKLTVKQGDRGLRQSNALFQHIENIPELIYDAFSKNIEGCELTLVSVSSKPREAKQREFLASSKGMRSALLHCVRSFSRRSYECSEVEFRYNNNKDTKELHHILLKMIRENLIKFN